MNANCQLFTSFEKDWSTVETCKENFINKYDENQMECIFYL